MAYGSVFQEAFVRFQAEHPSAEPSNVLPLPALKRQAQSAYGQGNVVLGNTIDASYHSQEKNNDLSGLTPQRALEMAKDIVHGRRPYDSLPEARHLWLSRDLIPEVLHNPGLVLSDEPSVYDACRYQSYVQAIQWMQQRIAEGLGMEETPNLLSSVYQHQAALQKILSNQEFYEANKGLAQNIESFLGVINPKEALKELSLPEKSAINHIARYDNRLGILVKSASPMTKAHIKAAYRRVLKQYHPDQSGNASTEAIIREVTKAYQQLKPLLQ